ncbi:hypothetical protein BABINDRAFT_160200 [Babjeviella inositovora NRRL Y-12698]|uniref:Uncharacterized protein n=1 Tax=Babjeviella inositovora NRRL Y-12698 TaxID=984486 RepID=A0A1E3QWV2_9ASCO|nr:uncharacterized protein BABINDRAFT_160200 [Babjeviella inositovora NRRL Y-12698]ODQ81984.1 hypothetical protein BABINDRAFT_160200 [Babjeviella inositovora NRRL Y-12698]
MTSLSAFKNVNNFDGRMVAEISLQYIIYCFIKRMEEAQDRENLPETHDQAQENSRGNSPAQNLPLSPLAHTKEELRTWQERWKKLLEQPASQFVVLGYHYGYLMVLYNWNFMKLSTAARTRASKPLATTLAHTDSTTLRLMLYHARKVVREILSVANDSYFAFLSDQIHFCTLFSAIMLINILRLVGSARTGDIDLISLSSGELAGYLSEISDLAKRFRRVATGESDVVMKYALTIEEEMRGVFPEEQIRGAYPVARK